MTGEIFLIAIGSTACFLIITTFLSYYILCRFKLPLLRKYYCKIGWHSIKYDNEHKADNDPNKFLNFAECQWCHYEGQVDSQGNLF